MQIHYEKKKHFHLRMCLVGIRTDSCHYMIDDMSHNFSDTEFLKTH